MIKPEFKAELELLDAYLVAQWINQRDFREQFAGQWKEGGYALAHLDAQEAEILSHLGTTRSMLGVEPFDPAEIS